MSHSTPLNQRIQTEYRELKLARTIGGGECRRNFVAPIPFPSTLWDSDPDDSPLMKSIIDAEFALLPPLPAVARRKISFSSDGDAESDSDSDDSLSGDEILAASESTRKVTNRLPFESNESNPMFLTEHQKISAEKKRSKIAAVIEKEMFLSRPLRKMRGSKASKNPIIATLHEEQLDS